MRCTRTLGLIRDSVQRTKKGIAAHSERRSLDTLRRVDDDPQDEGRANYIFFAVFFLAVFFLAAFFLAAFFLVPFLAAFFAPPAAAFFLAAFFFLATVLSSIKSFGDALLVN